MRVYVIPLVDSTVLWLVMIFMIYVEILPISTILTVRCISLEFEDVLDDPETSKDGVSVQNLTRPRICEGNNCTQKPATKLEFSLVYYYKKPNQDNISFEEDETALFETRKGSEHYKLRHGRGTGSQVAEGWLAEPDWII